MVPTQRQRSACIGLTVWLYLSMFWGRIKDPITYLAILRWLIIEPVPCLSEDRRMRREMTRRVWKRIHYTMTSERFQKTAENVAFWLLLVAMIAFIYVMASWECALGNSCFIANADLANYLFNGK